MNTLPYIHLAASPFTYAAFLAAQANERALHDARCRRARKLAQRHGISISFDRHANEYWVAPRNADPEDPFIGRRCISGFELEQAVRLFINTPAR